MKKLLFLLLLLSFKATALTAVSYNGGVGAVAIPGVTRSNFAPQYYRVGCWISGSLTTPHTAAYPDTIWLKVFSSGNPGVYAYTRRLGQSAYAGSLYDTNPLDTNYGPELRFNTNGFETWEVFVYSRTSNPAYFYFGARCYSYGNNSPTVVGITTFK